MRKLNGTGRVVEQARRRGPRFSVAHRAVFAAIVSEEMGWSTEWAAGLFCVNRAYVAITRRMSEDDHLRVLQGDISLSQIANPHRQPSDERVDRIIARIGPERILEGIDRWTQPDVVAAE